MMAWSYGNSILMWNDFFFIRDFPRLLVSRYISLWMALKCEKWKEQKENKKKTFSFRNVFMYHKTQAVRRRYRERQRAITLTPGISRLLIFLFSSAIFLHLDTFFLFSARLIFVLTAQKKESENGNRHFSLVLANYVIAIFFGMCICWIHENSRAWEKNIDVK